MPTIIPKGYYCPKCKKQLKKKICDCGTPGKPQPPYTVRFRWINEDGIEEHKRLTGTAPWTTQSAAQKGYEAWIAAHPNHEKSITKTVEFMPLYEEYKRYLKANVKDSSYLAFTQRMDAFVVPVFKSKKVTDITAADIRKWQDDLTNQGYSYKYKTAIRGAFNHFFAYLGMYNIPNPIAKVKGYKKSLEGKNEVRFWTEEEFKQFISTVKDIRYKTFFAFLYLTGCRKGEALALQWKDFIGDSVKIDKTLNQKTTDKKWKLTPPKTPNSYRSIILPHTLLALIDEYKNTVPHRDDDFVFGGEKNLSYTTVAHAFERYIRLSGVKPIRIHDLRHSHASLLINKGHNELSTIYIIAARLGDTVEMIFKTYGHLFPSNQKDLLSKIEIQI